MGLPPQLARHRTQYSASTPPDLKVRKVCLPPVVALDVTHHPTSFIPDLMVRKVGLPPLVALHKPSGPTFICGTVRVGHRRGQATPEQPERLRQVIVNSAGRLKCRHINVGDQAGWTCCAGQCETAVHYFERYLLQGEVRVWDLNLVETVPRCLAPHGPYRANVP